MRDCTEPPVNQQPLGPRNSQTRVNLVMPEVTLATGSSEQAAWGKMKSPAKVWQRLKKEAVQTTRELQAEEPQQKGSLETTNQEQKNKAKASTKWIRKEKHDQADKETQGSQEEPDQRTTSNNQPGEIREVRITEEQLDRSALWKSVSERINKLSLEMSRLIQAVPTVEEVLEK